MGGHGRLSGQSLGAMEVTVKGPRRLSVGAISTLYEVMAYGGHGGHEGNGGHGGYGLALAFLTSLRRPPGRGHAGSRTRTDTPFFALRRAAREGDRARLGQRAGDDRAGDGRGQPAASPQPEAEDE